MDVEPTSEEIVDALVKRYDILTHLTDGPVSQAELREMTDVSRATVHRAITKFVDLHILECDENKYRMTTFGERVLDRHRTYLDAIEEDCLIEQFVSRVPEGLSVDSPALKGAEMFFQQSGSADEAIYQNKSIIENANRVRKVLNGVMASYFLIHLEPAKYEGQEVEVIIPDRLADMVLNTYDEELRDLFGTGYFKLYKTSQPLKFSTIVAETDEETYTIVKVHDEGSVACAARNTTREAQEWAESRYDEYLQASEEITFQDNWTEATPID